MPEIHHVVVGTRNPTDDPLDRGDSEEGWYQVEGDLLTMVTADGAPLRAANGERIEAPITDGTAPRTVAARLVLSRWRNERSADRTVSGFGRSEPLRYRSSGWS